MPVIKRIMLIDDDHDDAEIFQDALAETGLEAVFAYVSDGYLACNLLATRQMPLPDLIFLDINMPTFDGWQCLKTLKNNAELQQIPVVMYSTTSGEKERRQAEALGAVNFLTKPNSYKDLRIKLLEVIGAL